MPARSISIFLCALLAACEPGYTQQAASKVAVTTAPPSAEVPPGGTAGFAAQVSGTSLTSVAWSVQEGSGGSVSDGGLYTAPMTAGSFHVVATSVADPTKSGSSSVTVTIGVAVSPLTIGIDDCTSTTFVATVVGSGNTAVTWSVLEGASGGTITSGGVYTAPSTPGTYHVVATSQADVTQSASAAVTTSNHVLSVSVTPSPVTLQVGGGQQFTAHVTNTCGTFNASRIFRPGDLKAAQQAGGAVTAGGR